MMPLTGMKDSKVLTSSGLQFKALVMPMMAMAVRRSRMENEKKYVALTNLKMNAV